MKVLIVEDDFITRHLLESYLSPYGKCHITVNGLEAIKAFRMALEAKEPYDLICLDILLPEMDGQEVLQEIRAIEKELNHSTADKARIIIISIISDTTHIKKTFGEHCDALIPKPIEKRKLMNALQRMGFIG